MIYSKEGITFAVVISLNDLSILLWTIDYQLYK